MQRTDGSAPPATPAVARGPRLEVVDALRGFALFGVAVSNVAVFAGTGLFPAERVSPLDMQLGLLEYRLITGKFLALFALTFGLSFGLYLYRCKEQGQAAGAQYLRRLAGLFLIGALHRILFGADILMTYALLGAVLLCFRNASNRVLLLAALCSLALPELWRMLAEALHYSPPAPVISRADRVRLATEGPYLELVGVRAVTLARSWVELLQQSLNFLPLFFLGLWAAHTRLLEAAERRPLLHAACWGGLLLAVCGYLAQDAMRPLLSAGAGPWTQAGFGVLYQVTTFVQAIGYGAGIALLWSRGGAARRILSPLVPAGRMALTNYLMISVVTTLVIGLMGSYGQLSLSAASALGALLWLVQLVLSAWWLRHFRLGPAEWVWRTMTHGRRQRMRGGEPLVQPS
jgi:uncharacterized protein